MKSGEFEDISVSRILHFFQGVGLLNAYAEIDNSQSVRVTVVPTLLYSIASHFNLAQLDYITLPTMHAHARIHTHARTHTHAYTHTHTHTHTS